MYASERFRRRVNKLRKEMRTAGERELEGELHAAFTICTSRLPQEMQNDVFDFLMDKYTERRAKHEDLFSFSDYIGDFIDLLSADYDERADPLVADDWEYVRDVVSDFAVELDMDLVNYVMRLVVDKGKL